MVHLLVCGNFKQIDIRAKDYAVYCESMVYFIHRYNQLICIFVLKNFYLSTINDVTHN